jgi:hypothetical protein
VAAIILALVALLDLVRIFMEWPVMIGDWSIPNLGELDRFRRR